MSILRAKDLLKNHIRKTNYREKNILNNVQHYIVQIKN